jgi:hypothetical protein
MRATEFFQHRSKLTLALVAVLACVSTGRAQQAIRIVDTQPSQKADRSIVFVCDATGSMIPKMPALRQQLSKTVHLLRPTQKFDIIFYSNGQTSSFSGWLKQPGTLSMALSPAKNRVDEFLDSIVARGDGGPLVAMVMALEARPEVIYLLSDGWFPEPEKVAKHIQELNVVYKIRINTIAFLNNDDIKHHVDAGFKKALQQIAEDNGGTFNDMNPDDL